MYGFTYTGMYLTSTPVSLPEINGVQTRYLLGALFALFALASMLMAARWPCEPAPGCRENAARVACAALRFLLRARARAALFQAYYIGP